MAGQICSLVACTIVCQKGRNPPSASLLQHQRRKLSLWGHIDSREFVTLKVHVGLFPQYYTGGGESGSRVAG